MGFYPEEKDELLEIFKNHPKWKARVERLKQRLQTLYDDEMIEEYNDSEVNSISREAIEEYDNPQLTKSKSVL